MNDGEKWKSQGFIESSFVGVWDQELVNLERTVSEMVGSIDGIVRDGTGLIVNYGRTTTKFVRAAKPSAATKEDMHMGSLVARQTARRKAKSPYEPKTGYTSCCSTL